MSNRKPLEKKDWMSSFALIGTPTITDYTYKIDEKSEKSSYVYNLLNLGVDCGEKHGVVYAEMMGGFNSEQAGVIYAHGKDEEGKDDFSTQIQVDWDDRFNESILADIGELCFITVGLEKTATGKTFYKKFLAAYDAIAYVKEHLEENMVINVKGNLKYSFYNDKVTVRKNITSIVLSKVDDPSKYYARFNQSILLTKDSIGEIDKAKGIIPIYARVLDYVKEYKGVEVRGQIPYNKTFEFEVDLDDKERVEKLINKVFKVKKDVTQITFEGDLIEGGAVVTATEDDIPQDIKDLIEIGVFTLEEALAKCSENGNREQRMVLRKPAIKMMGEEGAKTPVIQKFERRYTEDELADSLAVSSDNTDNATDEDEDVAEATENSSNDEDGMSWLDSL